eukprot:scaffold63549_cov74-Phaeocystis_antarctica.AAC.3
MPRSKGVYAAVQGAVCRGLRASMPRSESNCEPRSAADRGRGGCFGCGWAEEGRGGRGGRGGGRGGGVLWSRRRRGGSLAAAKARGWLRQDSGRAERMGMQRTARAWLVTSEGAAGQVAER